MRLLVTRPEPAGGRTAVRLRALGHYVILVPVLRVELVPNPELGDGSFGGLILTSANAVQALAQASFALVKGFSTTMPASSSVQ